MKKRIIISFIVSNISVIIGMQQPLISKYSENASKKLMTALKEASNNNIHKVIYEVTTALHEGADPNYNEYVYHSVKPIRGSLVPMDFRESQEMERQKRLAITPRIHTPLYIAVLLGNMTIINILLNAGAELDLKNIRDFSSVDSGTNVLKSAKEIALEKGLVITRLPKNKLP